MLVRFPALPPRARRRGRGSPLHLNPRNYEWVVEGDITACFDEISHPALMDRVRKRISDKRVSPW